MPATASAPPAAAAPPRKSIGSNARTVALATLASRVLGLVRDVGMASVFGMGATADAFYLAFTIPNSFRRLFGEGALSAAFIPGFIEARQRSGGEAARALFARTFGSLLTVLAAIAGAIVLVCGVLAFLGFGLTVELTSILALYTVPICLVALAMAALNAAGHFLLPALSPVVLNLLWIVALFAVLPFLPGEVAQVRGLAVVIVVAGLAQLLLQAPALRKRGLLVRPRVAFGHPDLVKIRRRMAPVIFGLAVFQINDLIDKGVAWLLVADAGAVSALYYANRLMQFPLALVGIAVGTAAFPVFAELWTAGKAERLRAVLDRSLGLVLLFALPAGVGLAAVAPSLIEVLFARDAFGAEAVARTVVVTLVYCAAVWAVALQAVLVRFFQAVDRRDLPVRAGLWAVALNLGLDFALVWSFAEAGLAVATVASAILQTALLLAWVRRPLGTASRALRGAPRILVAAAACGLSAWWLAAALPGLVGLVAGVLGGMLAYGLCALALFGRAGLRALVSRGR